jgi:fructose-1-phosphate kinase PfkB-like protein
VILTVTLNPALDVSYTVDALVPHGSHRVRSVTERAGGKGVNVARCSTGWASLPWRSSSPVGRQGVPWR